MQRHVHTPHLICRCWVVGSAIASAALTVPCALAQNLERIEIFGSAQPFNDARAQPATSVLRAADLTRAGVTTAEQALRRIAANHCAALLPASTRRFAYP